MAPPRARMSRAGGMMVGGADVRNERHSAGRILQGIQAPGTQRPAEDGDEHVTSRAGPTCSATSCNVQSPIRLAAKSLVGLPPDSGHYVPMIRKVTPQQVRTVAQKYFAPEKQSIVIVGDLSA